MANVAGRDRHQSQQSPPKGKGIVHETFFRWPAKGNNGQCAEVGRGSSFPVEATLTCLTGELHCVNTVGIDSRSDRASVPALKVRW